jgi:hypothetical protein
VKTTTAMVSIVILLCIFQDCTQFTRRMKYDKHDQHGKAAFNEHNPRTTQQQEPVARSQGDPKQKQDRAQGTPIFTLNYNNYETISLKLTIFT